MLAIYIFYNWIQNFFQKSPGGMWGTLCGSGLKKEKNFIELFNIIKSRINNVCETSRFEI